ncbi:ECEL1-like protein [Mya arenaria]|uniref:ECEL1-like protein n=1 Tax=Mya arenaria TaxID=6604 RepID=A0ABY7DDH3_MYAAR|nr:ECEL1-like protein [Mya arenaria]
MPVFVQSPWQLSALPIGRSEFSDDFCARQISRMFPMHYVIGNATIDGVNVALRHTFIDLISSVEEIIRDLYWMPIKQKQHLLTELSGLTMQVEWKAANEIFKSHVGKFGDDYFENMSEMIQGIAMESVRGERRRFPTTEGSSIFFLRNKVLALLRFLSEDKIDHRVALTIAFRLQCLLDEYNKYTVLQEDNNMYRLKGDLTKNANFKDSLALRTGYKAFMKNKKGRINISGLKLSEEQTFFLVYAQSMCEKTNTRGAKQFYINTETSHHSPGRYRVLGTLSHFKKFADAFHCSANTEMNPANKCSLF